MGQTQRWVTQRVVRAWASSQRDKKILDERQDKLKEAWVSMGWQISSKVHRKVVVRLVVRKLTVESLVCKVCYLDSSGGFSSLSRSKVVSGD